MSLNQSMYTGQSGVLTHRLRFDTISANMANVNTVAYKRANYEFNDLFYNNIRSASSATGTNGSVNPIVKGLGAVTGATTRIMTKGSLDSTGNPLNVAIDGNGFFVAHLGEQEYYTRDGNFYLYSSTMDSDASGNILEPKQLLVADGLAVQGYMAQNGVLPNGGALEDLFIPFGQSIAGIATTETVVGGNLNANVPVITPNVVPAGDWVTDNGQALTVGHVETTPEIWDNGGVVTENSDLIDLEYDTVGTKWFNNLADGDEVTIDFSRGGRDHSATFVYGDAGQTYVSGVAPNQVTRTGSGRTLGEFMTFLTGGLGDDGAAGTERLDGGAMGTVRLAGHTLGVDGFDTPAEHAGAYLRNDAGQMSLSIASNLGMKNALGDITLRHRGERIDDLFTRDAAYWESSSGGSDMSGVTLYEFIDNEIQEMPAWLHFDLVGRDSTSSTWRWLAESNDATGAAAGDPNRAFSGGIVRFDTSGNFLEQTTYGNAPVNFDLSHLDSTNMDDSVIVLDEQDGVKAGLLDDFHIDPDGLVHVHYDNGLSRIHAKLGLALIPNERGLTGVGDNLYTLSASSGEPVYNNDPDDGRFGYVRQYYLEGSNVTLQEEMMNIIQTQRGYQFNSKVITTSNELLETLLQLKR